VLSRLTFAPESHFCELLRLVDLQSGLHDLVLLLGEETRLLAALLFKLTGVRELLRAQLGGCGGGGGGSGG